jgi:hypothetical protein
MNVTAASRQFLQFHYSPEVALVELINGLGHQRRWHGYPPTREALAASAAQGSHDAWLVAAQLRAKIPT